MRAKQILSWMIGAPVAALLIGFAVANRHWVTVSFDPISKDNPWFAISMPAFVLLFAGIFIGLMVGGVVVWLRQGKWRKQARQAQTHATPSHATPSTATQTSHSTAATSSAQASSEGGSLTRLPGPAH